MKVTYLVDDIFKRQKLGLKPNEIKYYERWAVLPNKFHLTFRKDYIVYGIEYTPEGYENYLLVDDTEVSYFKFYPSEFFEIKDKRLSKYWFGDYGNYYPIPNIDFPELISFKEMVESEFYFDELLNSRNNAQELFIKYKKLMDKEFPDDDLATATVIDQRWVSCNSCDEVWEVNSDDGIIICPKCDGEFNNPFWHTPTHLRL